MGSHPMSAGSGPCATVGRRQALAVLAGAALAGCGRRARDPGAIVIGSSPTGVPFSFVDPWTNALAGSMVDTAKAIAGVLGLAPDMRITSFSALIPSLVAGKIDMVAAAILRTPEREKIVDFSKPVYAYSGALVVGGGDRGRYPELRALAGRRVGVQVGTRYVDQLKEAGVTGIATYDGLSDILRDLGNGRIDAGYGDEPILRHQLRVGPKRNARIAEGFTAPSREPVCLVLRKGDPLRARVDAAIDRLAAADLPAIVRRWGLS